MRYIPPLKVFIAATIFLGVGSPQAPSAADPGLEVTIRGDLPAEVVFRAGDLAKMPRETVAFLEQGGLNATYEGVPLREVLKRAGVPSGKELRGKALSSYVIAKAQDGYQVVFSVGELDNDFGHSSIVLADKRDGKPLAGSLGPLRLVCGNDKVAARSVRMLNTLEYVRLQK